MTAEPTTLGRNPGPPERRPVLRRLSPGDDLAGALGLMSGYVAEIRRNLAEQHGLELEEATPDSELLVQITGLLAAPQALYLAEVDGRPAGTGGLKEVRPGVAEVKRMYVDPAVRGRGIARAILERLLADARDASYDRLQLETAVWMVEAHALYRTCGFVEAPPHPDPEFAAYPGLEHLARYMTLHLKELPTP